MFAFVADCHRPHATDAFYVLPRPRALGAGENRDNILRCTWITRLAFAGATAAAATTAAVADAAASSAGAAGADAAAAATAAAAAAATAAADAATSAAAAAATAADAAASIYRVVFLFFFCAAGLAEPGWGSGQLLFLMRLLPLGSANIPNCVSLFLLGCLRR